MPPGWCLLGDSEGELVTGPSQRPVAGGRLADA